MAISKQQYAILSADVYLRGDGVLESGFEVPIGASILETYSVGSFFGAAYSLDGQIVIAFQGTDDWTVDMLTGWPLALGAIGFGDQVEHALAFYQSIEDSYSAPISLTGHSLGGGLAGFVAGIYGLEAYLIDHMPFDAGIETSYQWSIDPQDEGQEEWRDFVYGYATPTAPSLSNIHAISLDQDPLSLVRVAFPRRHIECRRTIDVWFRFWEFARRPLSDPSRDPALWRIHIGAGQRLARSCERHLSAVVRR